jgi:hypothetical protein
VHAYKDTPHDLHLVPCNARRAHSQGGSLHTTILVYSIISPQAFKYGSSYILFVKVGEDRETSSPSLTNGITLHNPTKPNCHEADTHLSSFAYVSAIILDMWVSIYPERSTPVILPHSLYKKACRPGYRAEARRGKRARLL